MTLKQQQKEYIVSNFKETKHFALKHFNQNNKKEVKMLSKVTRDFGILDVYASHVRALLPAYSASTFFHSFFFFYFRVWVGLGQYFFDLG